MQDRGRHAAAAPLPADERYRPASDDRYLPDVKPPREEAEPGELEAPPSSPDSRPRDSPVLAPHAASPELYSSHRLCPDPPGSPKQPSQSSSLADAAMPDVEAARNRSAAARKGPSLAAAVQGDRDSSMPGAVTAGRAPQHSLGEALHAAMPAAARQDPGPQALQAVQPGSEQAVSPEALSRHVDKASTAPVGEDLDPATGAASVLAPQLPAAPGGLLEASQQAAHASPAEAVPAGSPVGIAGGQSSAAQDGAAPASRRHPHTANLAAGQGSGAVPPTSAAAAPGPVAGDVARLTSASPSPQPSAPAKSRWVDDADEGVACSPALQACPSLAVWPHVARFTVSCCAPQPSSSIWCLQGATNSPW